MKRKLLYGEALQKSVLRSIKDLPPMQNVLHKARKIIENPSSSLKDVGMIIEADPALTINVNGVQEFR